jgi:hypothetical protein
MAPGITESASSNKRNLLGDESSSTGPQAVKPPIKQHKTPKRTILKDATDTTVLPPPLA